MKKTALAIVLALSLTFMLVSLPQKGLVKAESKTIIVPDDYNSIHEAIGNADDGDTILVKKGVYVENPEITKPVYLMGVDRDTTVIDVTAGLNIASDGVTITGFTIYDGWRGISLGANYCHILGNRIKNCTNGIVLFGYENTVSGNIFESIGLSSAIQLNFANKNYITGNHIDSCVEGIQIWQNSNNNTISENAITNCQDTAINFQYSNDNTLIRNNISHSGLGTSIYGSNMNIISNNNYISNIVQFGANESYYLTFGHNRSVNDINNNYWSDYNGADNNGDSIGDTPYIIDENNQDKYPLINAVAIASYLQNGYPTEFPSFSPSPSPTLEPSISPTPDTVPHQPEPFPTTLVIASVSVIVLVGISLLVYFKKLRDEAKPS